jgi:hypothetical protein
METLPNSLSRWTTEDLLGEVVRRSATDRPGLQLLETIVIRARLAESDHRVEIGKQPELTGVESSEAGRKAEMTLTDSEE